MIRSGEVSRARAEEIATMVLRTNAGRLYKLKLNQGGAHALRGSDQGFDNTNSKP
jgi:hypothetical protein